MHTEMKSNRKYNVNQRFDRSAVWTPTSQLHGGNACHDAISQKQGMQTDESVNILICF